VNADPLWFHQVIANLLSNGRKHTPTGSNIAVKLRSETAADKRKWAIIEVSDDGTGIPEEIRSQVFERFVRADPARVHDSEGSTGLGLAIVAGVVRANGGEVKVASSPEGTTFTVRWPLVVS
jgi:two-component system OmpR family sensor kinase